MGIKVNRNYFYVSKVGWVKMAETLRFNGKLMNVTISQSKTEKYFATFLVDTENFQKSCDGIHWFRFGSYSFLHNFRR